MRTTWVVIEPQPRQTRILALQPEGGRIWLKASLPPSPWSPKALPALLTALAQWQAAPVHAVLAVERAATTSDCTLWERRGGGAPAALYTSEVVAVAPRADRRSHRVPLGSFADLVHLLDLAVGHAH